MTKEQARQEISALQAELVGAVANAFCESWKFWVLYVAKSTDEEFPAWPESEHDDAENREKWHRLSKAQHEAAEKNIKIRERLRQLRRIAEEE